MPGFGLDRIFGCKRDICGGYAWGKKIEADWLGRMVKATARRERVILTTGKALAKWKDDNTAAIVENRYGKGRAYYLAGEFFLNFYDEDGTGLLEFIKTVTAKVYRPVITDRIKIIPRVLVRGDTWLVFAFNVSSKPENAVLSVDLKAASAFDFETGKPVKFERSGGKVSIKFQILPKSTRIFRLEK